MTAFGDACRAALAALRFVRRTRLREALGAADGESLVEAASRLKKQAERPSLDDDAVARLVDMVARGWAGRLVRDREAVSEYVRLLRSGSARSLTSWRLVHPELASELDVGLEPRIDLPDGSTSLDEARAAVALSVAATLLHTAQKALSKASHVLEPVDTSLGLEAGTVRKRVVEAARVLAEADSACVAALRPLRAALGLRGGKP